MDKENFDKEIAEYYDSLVEKGYHNNKKYLSSLFKIVKKGDKVLELGSGTGKILLEMLQKGVNAEGLDISRYMAKKLKSKNPNAIVNLSQLADFNSTKEYDYVLSCNGPFSIKGDEIESYILEKDGISKILNKYSKMAKNGLLINLGVEKPELMISLENDEMFVHKETKIKDYTVMMNFIFTKNKLNGNRVLIKRRYKLVDILKGAKVKDLGEFKLIKF